jgi:hypothetical protein
MSRELDHEEDERAEEGEGEYGTVAAPAATANLGTSSTTCGFMVANERRSGATRSRRDCPASMPQSREGGDRHPIYDASPAPRAEAATWNKAPHDRR